MRHVLRINAYIFLHFYPTVSHRLCCKTDIFRKFNPGNFLPLPGSIIPILQSSPVSILLGLLMYQFGIVIINHDSLINIIKYKNTAFRWNQTQKKKKVTHFICFCAIPIQTLSNSATKYRKAVSNKKDCADIKQQRSLFLTYQIIRTFTVLSLLHAILRHHCLTARNRLPKQVMIHLHFLRQPLCGSIPDFRQHS